MNIFYNIIEFFHKNELFHFKQVTFNQIFTIIRFHKNSPKGLDEDRSLKTPGYQAYKMLPYRYLGLVTLCIKLLFRFTHFC